MQVTAGKDWQNSNSRTVQLRGEEGSRRGSEGDELEGVALQHGAAARKAIASR